MQALSFSAYQPQSDHFNWAHAHERAMASVEAILPGLDLKSETPEGRRATRQRRRKAMATNARNAWINRQRLAQGDHNLRPIYFIWTMLNACNFACAYCDDHMGRKYPDLPEAGRLSTEEGKRLLEVMRTGTAAVYFCGGEPTMRKDLPEQVRHAASLGYFPNMINSNGSRWHAVLERPEAADLLSNLDIVIISLDGLSPGMLSSLYEFKDVEAVAANILMLRELKKHVKFKLCANSVITKDNIAEVSAVVDFCRDMDIWYVPVPVNEVHQPDRDLMSRPDYRALAEKILTRKREGQKIIGSLPLLKRLLHGEPVECHPTVKPHVDLTGEMIWPCKSSRNIEPVRVRMLDYPDYESAARAAEAMISPHHFHGPAANQCGGNCRWMQNCTTDAYVRGIRHPIQSGILAEIKEFTGSL